MACKVWLYGLPTLPPASDVVTMLSGGWVTAILRVAVLVARVGVSESVTDTVKVKVVVVVPLGVPEIAPLLLKVKPGGKLPEVRSHV